MIDVVDITASFVQLDEVAEDRDEVVAGQHRHARVGREPESLIDLVPADAAEVVPLRAEEKPLESETRGRCVGRVAGPQKTVDLTERELLALGRRDGRLDGLAADLPDQPTRWIL